MILSQSKIVLKEKLPHPLHPYSILAKHYRSPLTKGRFPCVREHGDGPPRDNPRSPVGPELCAKDVEAVMVKEYDVFGHSPYI